MRGRVFGSFANMLNGVQGASHVTIDIPIGLPLSRERDCDVAARRLLRAPRSSSVFPAPVYGVVQEDDYQRACEVHRQIDGRALSRQAFAILPKIREVNGLMWSDPAHQQRVREVHPEVCFAVWNRDKAMQYRKAIVSGRLERQVLIDEVWPGQWRIVRDELSGHSFEIDDLNDAFAALWTAKRIASGDARTIGSGQLDPGGLRMEMWA